MRDIHCHILPGVDDGAADLDESLAMLEAAKRAGVTRIVCTPHCRDPYFDYDKMWDAFELLRDNADGFPLQMGFEVNHRKLVELGIDAAEHLHFDGTNEFLLELSTHADAYAFREYENTIYDLQCRGYQVIIAHPERYRAVQKDVSVAERLVDMGFRAVKIRFSHEKTKDDIAIIETVRKAVGNKLEIMVDANQGTACERNNNSFPPIWSYNRALETAREMERLQCAWLEEPLWRYDFDGLARLNAAVDIPIAGGEINIGIPDFKLMLDKGCFDILQPNCTMSTGISYIRKIAALADSYGKIVNPHAYIPGMGVLQSMHLVASYTNFTWLEYPCDPPSLTPEVFQGVLKENYLVDKIDGCIPMPLNPGFGVDVDEELVKKYSILER